MYNNKRRMIKIRNINQFVDHQKRMKLEELVIEYRLSKPMSRKMIFFEEYHFIIKYNYAKHLRTIDDLIDMENYVIREFPKELNLNNNNYSICLNEIFSYSNRPEAIEPRYDLKIFFDDIGFLIGYQYDFKDESSEDMEIKNIILNRIKNDESFLLVLHFTKWESEKIVEEEENE